MHLDAHLSLQPLCRPVLSDEEKPVRLAVCTASRDACSRCLAPKDGRWNREAKSRMASHSRLSCLPGNHSGSGATQSDECLLAHTNPTFQSNPIQSPKTSSSLVHVRVTPGKVGGGQVQTTEPAKPYFKV
ncbi:hypothetical protein ONS95_013292 [Cadophora gregata]|uniref:uncharacterized protein n=1 Tax=Cadophora gregata TaxID=51156 RepID=UPI0026DD028B|nr:uncharacterized protein ONS95_013292 [Cadophora gregata]KAK0099884.1 hypothetical protein ONS96_007833 [Cadophora gregata f. sp. sojae]KAK0116266.1 hypothetical protein ONS95_013292 [Cadophora gregata]